MQRGMIALSGSEDVWPDGRLRPSGCHDSGQPLDADRHRRDGEEPAIHAEQMLQADEQPLKGVQLHSSRLAISRFHVWPHATNMRSLMRAPHILDRLRHFPRRTARKEPYQCAQTCVNSPQPEPLERLCMRSFPTRVAHHMHAPSDGCRDPLIEGNSHARTQPRAIWLTRWASDTMRQTAPARPLARRHAKSRQRPSAGAALHLPTSGKQLRWGLYLDNLRTARGKASNHEPGV